MIIVKGRELLIPENERYIGTNYDAGMENRLFRISRYSQSGTDLSDLTFKINLIFEGDPLDRAELTKVVDDEYIYLTWTVTKAQVAVTGTVFVCVTGNDTNDTVKWSSFQAPFYTEKSLGDDIDTAYHDLVNRVAKEITDRESAVAAEKSAREAADAAENRRIDNIVAQSGDDITEIVDARTGADSTVHASLKARLDSEHTDLKNALNDIGVVISPENKFNASKINDGQSLNSSGKLTGNANLVTSDFIPVNGGDTVYFYRINSSDLLDTSAKMDYLCQYTDKDEDTFIGERQAALHSYTVANNCKFIRFVQKKSNFQSERWGITLNKIWASYADYTQYFNPYYATKDTNLIEYIKATVSDNITLIEDFEWEDKDITVSNGALSYTPSTKKKATKEGKTYQLGVGDKIYLTDYSDGSRYSFTYSTDNGTTWADITTKSAAFVVQTAGLYVFRMQNTTSSIAITHEDTLRFRIEKAGCWKGTVNETLEGYADKFDRVLVKNVVPLIASANNIHGINFHQNSDGSFTISGEIESGYEKVQRVIYYSKTVMPSWISPGRYRVRLVGFDKRIELHGYEYDESQVSTTLFIVKNDDVYDFTVTENAHGFALYMYVIDDIPTAITVKPLISPAEILTGSGASGSKSIVSLNADREPLIIQNKAVRGTAFESDHTVITFTHFSDIHAKQELWNRVAEFTNKYKKYINFAIMTGDYVGDNLATSYVDLIGDGTPFEVPLYMCVGNHDTYEDSNHTQASKADAYAAVFTGASTSGATFMTGDYSMTFYVDFAGSNLRIIVLDNYYDKSAQVTWLETVLASAKTNGYAVATFMHQPTAKITVPLDCTFMTIDDHSSQWGTNDFESVIAAFISGGGEYVGNFCGHWHCNYIGYTANGVLNIVVPAATDYVAYNDSARVNGTRTHDCFNVVGIDTNTKMLKIIRIGNNADHYLRNQNVLCYDYANKEIICNY